RAAQHVDPTPPPHRLAETSRGDAYGRASRSQAAGLTGAYTPLRGRDAAASGRIWTSVRQDGTEAGACEPARTRASAGSHVGHHAARKLGTRAAAGSVRAGHAGPGVRTEAETGGAGPTVLNAECGRRDGGARARAGGRDGRGRGGRGAGAL